MRIAADPTELHKRSTLSKAVKERAVQFNGLEERTGADLLLSSLPLPFVPGTLERHCESGFLVQLKRWADVQTSIVSDDNRFFRSLFKMQRFTSYPWLIVTGVPFKDEMAKVVVGKVSSSTRRGGNSTAVVTGRPGISYAAYLGAIGAWQLRGGYYMTVQSEEDMTWWLNRMGELLDEDAIHELKPRPAYQELRGPTRVSWLSALFHGIGPATSRKIWDYLDSVYIHNSTKEPALIDAISFCTSSEAAEIPGITPEMIEDWRDILGLKTHRNSGIREVLRVEFEKIREVEESDERD
jgi:hypothetical protein